VSCRVDVLAQLVDFLDGTVVDHADECAEQAAFRVAIVRAGEGWDMEMWAEVCEGHEQAMQTRDDYSRSIRLRT
jgi:hypothetical protein